MKTLLFFLCLSFSCLAIEGERFKQSEEAVQQSAYGHIDARGLKALIDSMTPMVMIDARGQGWNEAISIEGAKLARYDDNFEVFRGIIPRKNSLVIIFCYSFTCPLSPRLGQKLIELGYTNIIEYPGGVLEWSKVAKYPIQPI